MSTIAAWIKLWPSKAEPTPVQEEQRERFQKAVACAKGMVVSGIATITKRPIGHARMIVTAEDLPRHARGAGN